MNIVKKISEVREIVREKKMEGRKVGLVPTMGALHDGHLSLIDRAGKENDVTVCSIYVNPTQFNQKEDFNNYPVTLEADLDLLTKRGCDVVFVPDSSEMYEEEESIWFRLGPLDKVMEGKHRPGHFDGVVRVVAKLFNIICPDKAYFGQKDLQQFVMIDQLNRNLKFGIDLFCMPTIREPDGLAMSSRNKRLDDDQRNQAVMFYKSLERAHRLLEAGKSVMEVKKEIKELFEDQPGVSLEYFEIADPVSLGPLENLRGKKELALCVAGYVGKVRLIDNIIIEIVP